MKNKRKIWIFLFMFISVRLFSKEFNINEDLSYLKYLLEQAYAGYDYNVANGTDYNKLLKNVQSKYNSLLKDNKTDNIDIFAKCIDEELIQKNLPDNHFFISTDKKYYGIVSHYWSYSPMIIEKRENRYFVYNPSEDSIPEGTEYTGSKENLFPCYYNGDIKYYVGCLSVKFEKLLTTSFDNKTVQIPLYGDYIVQKHNWINMYTTEKTFYLSIGDCNLYNEDSKKHKEAKLLLDNCIQKLHKKKYENIILDLRGNNGGTENNILPVLLAINSEPNKKKEDEFTKKIRFLRNGEKDYFSTPINEAFYEYYKTNSGIKIDNLDDYKNNKEKKRFSIVKFPDNNYKSDFKGRLFILMNTFTASAAEQIILDAHLFENVILLGTNTMGGIDYESLLTYELPNSRIQVNLPATSHKETTALQINKHWHGDTFGFYPDYWCTSFDLLPTLIELTDDVDLENVLFDLEKGLL